MAKHAPQFNSISTTEDHWQIQCWNWAKAKTPFQIEGTLAKHRIFLDELSHTYGYKLKHGETVIIFVPGAVA